MLLLRHLLKNVMLMLQIVLILFVKLTKQQRIAKVHSVRHTNHRLDVGTPLMQRMLVNIVLMGKTALKLNVMLMILLSGASHLIVLQPERLKLGASQLQMIKNVVPLALLEMDVPKRHVIKTTHSNGASHLIVLQPERLKLSARKLQMTKNVVLLALLEMDVPKRHVLKTSHSNGVQQHIVAVPENPNPNVQYLMKNKNVNGALMEPIVQKEHASSILISNIANHRFVTHIQLKLGVKNLRL